MKVKQALIQRAVKNGAIEKTNRLLSAAHILNCEANGLIEEANDILRENGLLVGELKKYHTDFVKCADRYFTEFSTMVEAEKKMDMFTDMEEFDKWFRQWTKILEERE